MMKQHRTEEEVEKLYSQPVLRVGSKGETVMLLQAALEIERSGVFDSETEKYVKAYQRAKGLYDDGVVGALTWAEILKG